MNIFISHSKKDNKIVKKIVELFKKYGVKYWVDSEQLELGKAVQKRIDKGIEDADIFFLVWSKNAKGSDWVDSEKSAALEYTEDELPRVILRLDDTKLGTFAAFKYLNAKENKNLEKIIKQFIYENADIISQSIIFKERVCYDYENWSKDESYDPIIKNFKKFDGYNYYVSQPYSFLSYTESIQNISKHILEKISTKNEIILIVGDYGNGKSGLCHHVLYELSKNNSEKRIMIFIPFGDLKEFHNDEKNDLLVEILQYIKKEYKFNITIEQIQELIKNKQIVFILDALDELSPKLDSTVARNNLKHIVDISKNIPILLTSRHTYISDGIPKELLKYKNAIKVLDFETEHINEFMQLKFKKNQKKILQVKAKITSNKKLKQIIEKPIFLNILCDKFQEIKNLKFINEAILFRILSIGWIQHDLTKKNPILSKKEIQEQNVNQRCSERLAIAEYSSEKPVSIEEIQKLIEKEFKYEKSNVQNEFKFYSRYARDATFLSVESNNSFRFLLRPFLEYFVASRIVRDINNYNDKKFLKNICLEITPEIYNFVLSILEADWLVKPQLSSEISSANKILKEKIDLTDNLFNILNEQRINGKKPWLGNIVKILSSFNKTKGIDLSKLNLEKLEIIFMDLREAILDDANLRRAELNGATLSNASLKNVNLTDAKLNRSDLNDANLNGAILNGTQMSEANLSGAQMVDVKLIKTLLDRANLSGVNLLDATMNEVILTESNMVAADCTNAILVKGRLIGANLNLTDFTDADLNGATLISANISGSKFVRTKNMPISKEEMKKRGAEF